MSLQSARQNAFSFLTDFFKRIREDHVPDLAAQLAFYFLLSLFPFLIFVIALISYLPLTTGDVLFLLKRFAPPETIALIENNLEGILEHRRGGLLSFGALFSIWSASNAVNAMMRALNRAYDAREGRPFLVARGVAILLTFLMIIAIVVALVLPVFGEFVGAFLFVNVFDFATVYPAWEILRWLISFLVIVAVFACLYYFAPNARLCLHDVLFGAVFAAVGWQIVSLGFSYYVTHFANYEATYGSLGGMIVLMIWFYLTAFIIIVGGELNALLRFGERRR